MKTQDKQIIQKLQAYDPSSVLKAFELYEQAYLTGDDRIQKDLEDDGWKSQKDKPAKEIPSYFINNLYWVLTDKAREKKIQKIKEDHLKKVKKSVKTRKKVSADLTETTLRCPTCNSKMYKQRVCPGCTNGKKGYLIRLICENNPDHELLI